MKYFSFAASLGLVVAFQTPGASAQSVQGAVSVQVTQPTAPPAYPPPPPGSPWVMPQGDPAAPTAYVVPPGYVLQRALPERIPYEGGPVPPGMRVHSRPRLGLVIGGAITFGATWLLSAYVGFLAEAFSGGYSGSGSSPAGWLVLPVFGPLITAASGDVSSQGWSVLVLDALVQAGGLTMFVVGFTNPNRTLVPVQQQGARSAPARPHWALLPGTASGAHGATFTLAF